MTDGKRLPYHDADGCRGGEPLPHGQCGAIVVDRYPAGDHVGDEEAVRGARNVAPEPAPLRLYAHQNGSADSDGEEGGGGRFQAGCGLQSVCTAEACSPRSRASTDSCSLTS